MKIFSFFIKFFLLVSLLCSEFSAQNATLKDSIPKKRRAFFALPVVFYTPETRFGFGASAFTYFNFRNDSLDAAKSNVSLGFAFTQNKQTLFAIPYNLFIKNRSYHLYGEIGYNKYFYNFYGVGNEQPKNFVERYGVEFPRLRVTALKKIVPHFYAGLRYAYDKFSLFKLDTAGQLAKGTIPGSKGGVVSGIGLVFVYDSRDFIFYPSKGIWTELVIYHDDPATGSSFNYIRIAFDFSKYFSYKENILALNAYSLYSDSDLPFFQMGVLGGQKKMRGFYEGRYRDNNALVFQAEFRRHLFWVLGFTVFGDVGQVAHRYSEFNTSDWKYTYGLGLRLMTDKKQKLNLRIDFAVGNKKLLPYFTVGEAF